MSPDTILLSTKFLSALFVYILLITVSLPILDRVHARLENSVLQWKWDHIAIPLAQAAMVMVFILMAYPVIYGIEEAPEISTLLAKDDLRINHLINLIFVISLLFPLIPLLGNWHELVLPLQGIAASMMIFSWLASGLGVTQFSYWPGWEVVSACLALGVTTHWLAVQISQLIGHKLDKEFNVLDSGELFARGLILLFQCPVILIFSTSLGKQLPVT
ncbi:MAG: hypothetical protein HKN08_05990 [Gammaproteobacteria bacterium]|nr:hypothetical protein [Gammaproteobacteria bacterium]